MLYDLKTGDESSKALGALDCCDTVVSSADLARFDDYSNVDDVSSKALGGLAVAQRDISRAQNCAREIGPR